MSKSLDEQLTTIETNIKETIEDYMSLVASDTNVYSVFPDDLMYNSNLSTSDVCTITLPHSGSVKLRFRFGTSYTLGANDMAYLYIYKNGVQYFSYHSSLIIGSCPDEAVTLKGQRGDVFKISVQRTYKGAIENGSEDIWLYLYNLLATPIPSKAVTITAI